MILGILNSKFRPVDIFLNITFLSLLLDGVESLRKGEQTSGLVAGKKMDAICRSMPSICLQLFAVLLDVENLDRTQFIVLITSVGFGIFGSAGELSRFAASHRSFTLN